MDSMSLLRQLELLSRQWLLTAARRLLRIAHPELVNRQQPIKQSVLYVESCFRDCSPNIDVEVQMCAQNIFYDKTWQIVCGAL
jgi:hypothetical protein